MSRFVGSRALLLALLVALLVASLVVPASAEAASKHKGHGRPTFVVTDPLDPVSTAPVETLPSVPILSTDAGIVPSDPLVPALPPLPWMPPDETAAPWEPPTDSGAVASTANPTEDTSPPATSDPVLAPAHAAPLGAAGTLATVAVRHVLVVGGVAMVVALGLTALSRRR